MGVCWGELRGGTSTRQVGGLNRIIFLIKGNLLGGLILDGHRRVTKILFYVLEKYRSSGWGEGKTGEWRLE